MEGREFGNEWCVIRDRHPVWAFTSLFWRGIRCETEDYFINYATSNRASWKQDDWQLSNYSPLSPLLLLSHPELATDSQEVVSTSQNTAPPKFVASAAPSRFGHFVRAIYLSFGRPSSTSDLRGALCKYHAHGPGKWTDSFRYYNPKQVWKSTAYQVQCWFSALRCTGMD